MNEERISELIQSSIYGVQDMLNDSDTHPHLRLNDQVERRLELLLKSLRELEVINGPTLGVFLEKVTIEANNGCWLWTGYLMKAGYGVHFHRAKQHLAHRMSYMLHRGYLADTEMVLHKCDTPACVNPDHLFLGDAMANSRDMIAKGRAAFQKRKMHCDNGHEYTPENTLFRYVSKRNRNQRTCRQCQKDRFQPANH